MAGSHTLHSGLWLFRRKSEGHQRRECRGAKPIIAPSPGPHPVARAGARPHPPPQIPRRPQRGPTRPTILVGQMGARQAGAGKSRSHPYRGQMGACRTCGRRNPPAILAAERWAELSARNFMLAAGFSLRRRPRQLPAPLRAPTRPPALWSTFLLCWRRSLFYQKGQTSGAGP